MGLEFLISRKIISDFNSGLPYNKKQIPQRSIIRMYYIFIYLNNSSKHIVNECVQQGNLMYIGGEVDFSKSRFERRCRWGFDNSREDRVPRLIHHAYNLSVNTCCTQRCSHVPIINNRIG